MKASGRDMLHGPLLRPLLLFTLPIALSSMIQQLFNAADTAVVGYFGDRHALAAVGANTEVVALIVTVSSGLAVGANLLIARQLGQGKTEDIPAAVRTALLSAAVIGVIGLLAGQAAAEPLLRLMHTPKEVIGAAALYLRIYMLGYPFLLLYDFGAAVLRAHGDSRYPFFVLLLSGGVNVVLNLIFVAGLRMGVAGVAAATGLSTALAALALIRRLAGAGRGTSPRKPLFSPYMAGDMLKIGIPSAVQGAVFCLANLFVQTAVNRFGETAMAGSTVAINFEYFTYYILTSFGQTAATFTAQNYAAGQIKRCRRILRLCLGASAVCSAVPILTIVLFRDFFSGLFTPEPAVVAGAAARILGILLFEPLCCLYEVPAGVLRGSGHALHPAVSTVLGTCVFRIVWIYTVFRASPALPTLYAAFPLSWMLTALLCGAGFLILHPLRDTDAAR